MDLLVDVAVCLLEAEEPGLRELGPHHRRSVLINRALYNAVGQELLHRKLHFASQKHYFTRQVETLI